MLALCDVLVLRILSFIGVSFNGGSTVFIIDRPDLSQRTKGGSAGLLRCGKGSTWEGGMRAPAIAWWPGKIRHGRTNKVHTCAKKYLHECKFDGISFLHIYIMYAVVYNYICMLATYSYAPSIPLVYTYVQCVLSPSISWAPHLTFCRPSSTSLELAYQRIQRLTEWTYQTCCLKETPRYIHLLYNIMLQITAHISTTYRARESGLHTLKSLLTRQLDRALYAGSSSRLTTTQLGI